VLDKYWLSDYWTEICGPVKPRIRYTPVVVVVVVVVVVAAAETAAAETAVAFLLITVYTRVYVDPHISRAP